MSTRRTPQLAIPSALVCLALGACVDPAATTSVDTDTFVRNALDAYGVINVVPASSGPPLSATSATAATGTATTQPRQMTLQEACEGKSGVQPRLINAQTRQPIDCGPASATAAPTS